VIDVIVFARKVSPARRRAAGRRIAANIRRLQRLRTTRTAGDALIERQRDDSCREEIVRELAFHVMVERGLADCRREAHDLERREGAAYPLYGCRRSDCPVSQG
jgi:hypothetical protein